MFLVFAAAAVCEIAGCFSFWAWIREGRSGWWIAPGIVSLIGFAYLLTLIDASHAGRAYAAYGGIYVFASVCWLVLVERAWPDRWDCIGVGLCLIGTAVILWGPR